MGLGPSHLQRLRKTLCWHPRKLMDCQSPDPVLRFLWIPGSLLPQGSLCRCPRPRWTLGALSSLFPLNSLSAKYCVRLITLLRVCEVAGRMHLTGHSQLSVISTAQPSQSPVHCSQQIPLLVLGWAVLPHTWVSASKQARHGIFPTEVGLIPKRKDHTSC